MSLFGREPDELRADRGSGRLSVQTDREFRELSDPAHPRQFMSPMSELEISDERVELAAADEWATCFDPNEHPKDFFGMKGPDEPIADASGCVCDLELDTPSIGVELGETDRDFFDLGLPELDDLRVGPL